MERQVRLGLLGAGRWGQRYIATLNGISGVRLAAVASRNPNTAKLVASDCRVVANWQELLTADDVDGIVVATPPHLHCEMACAGLAAGLTVMLEKPMTPSSSEASQVAAASQKHQRAVLVVHTHLFSPAFRKLKTVIGAMGAVMSIEGEAGNSGPIRADTTMLWDWAPHDIAMCLDILGAEARVVSATRRAKTPDPSGRADDIEANLSFGRGIPVRIWLSNIRADKRRWFRVACEGGWAVFDDWADAKLTVGTHGDAEGRSVSVAPDMPLTIAVSEFADLCRRRAPGHPSLEIGVACVGLIEQIDAVVNKSAAAQAVR